MVKGKKANSLSMLPMYMKGEDTRLPEGNTANFKWSFAKVQVKQGAGSITPKTYEKDTR